MLELIISAVQAIMQVMVIVFLGAILSKRGYIDNEKQRWLSKFNLVFFTPCLLYSNIAPTISYERLLAYWPIPVFYFTFILIAWALCQPFISLFGISSYYRRFVTACVMFGNTNSLPVAIISSLAVSEAGKILFLGYDDTQEQVYARGISYTLFFGLFCNIFRWSYGYNLLQKKDSDFLDDKYGSNQNHSRSATLSEEADIEDTAPSSKEPSAVNETTGLLSLEPKKSKVKQLLITLNQFMSPPLYAALLAMCVGLCPPLKHLLHDRHSFFYASITRAIESCGRASVPIVLVSLGAQLKSIRDTQRSSTSIRHSAAISISLSLFLRMILTPMIVLPLVFAFAKYGQEWSELAKDPIFLVSMTVVGCTPTAINLSQITQVSGIFEEEMLTVLFWSYGVICIPVCTLVVFLALMMVGHLA